jgi:hypothetical protein
MKIRLRGRKHRCENNIEIRVYRVWECTIESAGSRG